jgi:hypothetical protein
LQHHKRTTWCTLQEASLKYTGRPEGVYSLFFDMGTGQAYTPNSLTVAMGKTLEDILVGQGLPMKNPRAWRHMFATGLSSFVSTLSPTQLKQHHVQALAAKMTGSSSKQWQVGRASGAHQ